MLIGIISYAQSTIHIRTYGGSYPTEKWVNITTEIDGGGTQIWGQGDGTYGNEQGLIDLDVDIAPGTYYVNCYDRYSDGWDGSLISITAYGVVIGDNGGESPSNPDSNDADSTWEGPDSGELEASFQIIVPEAPSCIPPSSVTFSDITDSSVTASWTAGGTETEWNVEYGVSGFTQGEGAIFNNLTETSYTYSGLTGSTIYQVYIQSVCGDETSNWSGPFEFTTLCSTITPDYTADMSQNPPLCWDEAGSGEIAEGPQNLGSSLWNNNYNYADADGNSIASNNINLFYNSEREWLITPSIDLSGGDYILETTVAVDDYGSSTADDAMGSDDEVHLLISVDDGATWNSITTWNVDNEPLPTGTDFTADLSTYDGVVKFAFFASDGEVNDPEDYDFHIGKFIIKTPPTEVPACAENLVATVDDNCGNYPATLTWDSVNGASGYSVTIGTTSGGDDIVSAQNVGSTTSYAFSPTSATTYYWSVTPYNSVGNADGCAEAMFTTADASCYCIPVSTSEQTYIDSFTTVSSNSLGSNISNTGSGYSDAGYIDNFDTMMVSAMAGQTFDFTLEGVGGTFGAAIWIDWNQDYSFDVSEVVFNTTEHSDGPFTGTITIPNGTADGDYRMRVLLDWYRANPAEHPCDFASSRGEAEDYKVTVDSSMSTTNFASSQTITIYPNPVQDRLSIKSTENIDAYTIYDINGQVILAQKGISKNNVNVDMSSLKTGVYIIQTIRNGKPETFKVIKK